MVFTMAEILICIALSVWDRTPSYNFPKVFATADGRLWSRLPKLTQPSQTDSAGTLTFYCVRLFQKFLQSTQGSSVGQKK